MSTSTNHEQEKLIEDVGYNLSLLGKVTEECWPHLQALHFTLLTRGPTLSLVFEI